MIFLTVGTQFPFNRLVESVDMIFEQNGFEEKVFAQINNSSYRPRNFEAVPFLEKSQFDKCICKASCVISHAGMGTIMAVLEHEKPLLIMPRLKKYNEVVNDHQLAIARRFEQLGHVLVAYDMDDLPKALKQLKTFVPLKRKTKPQAVSERIAQFLKELYLGTKVDK
jgi:UDP-N-acetylglucosamine transferase subunit ALG13